MSLRHLLLDCDPEDQPPLVQDLAYWRSLGFSEDPTPAANAAFLRSAEHSRMASQREAPFLDPDTVIFLDEHAQEPVPYRLASREEIEKARARKLARERKDAGR